MYSSACPLPFIPIGQAAGRVEPVEHTQKASKGKTGRNQQHAMAARVVETC